MAQQGQQPILQLPEGFAQQAHQQAGDLVAEGQAGGDQGVGRRGFDHQPQGQAAGRQIGRKRHHDHGGVGCRAPGGCRARCRDRRRWDSRWAAGQLGSFAGRDQGIGGVGVGRTIRTGLIKGGIGLGKAPLPLLIAPLAHGFGDGSGAVAAPLVQKLEQILLQRDRNLTDSQGHGSADMKTIRFDPIGPR